MNNENKYFSERIRKGFDELDLPEHMYDGVELYVTQGVMPGGFLTAVLENKLVESVVKADNHNLKRIREWAAFIYNYLPLTCWGSETLVRAWSRKRQALQRREESKDG